MMEYSGARDVVEKIIDLIKAEREVNHFKNNSGPGLHEAMDNLEGIAQDLQILLVEETT
jgi:hypothetical protein